MFGDLSCEDAHHVFDKMPQLAAWYLGSSCAVLTVLLPALTCLWSY